MAGAGVTNAQTTGTTSDGFAYSDSGGAVTITGYSGTGSAGANGSTGVALAEIYEVSSVGTRLANISTRAQVGTGANILIPGFVIAGGCNEELLVRADGPSIAQFGLTGVLASPSLSVSDVTGTILASNTGWGTGTDSSDVLERRSDRGRVCIADG